MGRTDQSTYQAYSYLIEWSTDVFDPEEVKAFFYLSARDFQKATVLFDMLAYSLVGHAKNHDSLGSMNKKHRPEFKWSERDSHTLEHWHPALHVEREYFMSDYNRGRYPFYL